MKLAPQFKVEKCASKDRTRAHLAHPHLDVEKKRLAATNGYCMAVVPVEVDDGDRSGLIPAPAVAASRRADVKAKKRIAICGEVMHVRSSATFPDIEKSLPSFKPGDEGTLTFGIDAFLLLMVAEALGAKSGGHGMGLVSLTVKLPETGKAMLDPIIVHRRVDGSIGLVMPGRL